jgi:L-ascorbate metabolism protein UlaG (beta-lactamase superfamily)
VTPPISDHFNGKPFFQPGGTSAGRLGAFLRWRLTQRAAPWPARVPVGPQPPPPAPRGGEIVATWIGHATFLLGCAAGNVLTDPVFSPCAGPLGRLGPRRVIEPGLAFRTLPKISVVLLSHDHYDHCDLPTLRRLAREHDPLFVAPLRHRDLLERAGARRLVELDWWQTHETGGLGLTLTPAQHWSNRLGSPRNHRLWGGYFLRAGTKRVWFAGDTGYHGGLFAEIGTRCGPPDLAMLPIGAYEPRWFMQPMHLNPAEAVRAHRDVGARLSLAMHWGTFRLTDEARDAPPAALAAARTEAGMADNEFRVPAPGESLVV